MIPKMNTDLKAQTIEESMLTRLREKGYKITPQRREIISIIAKDATHPRAADILRKARSNAPHISVSTVYYSLALFKKEGLIREIEFYDMDNRYDTNTDDHLNLICLKCGTIEDFHGELPISPQEVAQVADFQPVRMRFECYGYCSKCLKKQK